MRADRRARRFLKHFGRAAAQTTLKVFFSAGEPSGDSHGANLIRALRRQDAHFEAVGYGGPEMAAAGCRLEADLTSLAVMWFLRALANLHRFANLASRADRYFRHQRPDAVVLIDFPGFNWWIARRAKAHGIPVYYYAPPQIWAWARWRVKKMRKFVDHILCALPFEADWFRNQGCKATFVGHPFFDELEHRPLDEAFLEKLRRREGPLVAILPGSRTQEVTQNLRWFLKAAEQVQRQLPETRFAIAAFKPHQAEFARQAASKCGLPIDVYVRKTHEIVEAADCCMAVSGSVSLELLYHAKPTVILYWINQFAYWVQGFFRKVKYITLVNLLRTDELFPKDLTPYDPAQADADRVLFPEYLTSQDKSNALAEHVVRWLTDDAERRRVIGELKTLKSEVAHGGAADSAAKLIAGELRSRPPMIPRPHFRGGMKVTSSKI